MTDKDAPITDRQHRLLRQIEAADWLTESYEYYHNEIADAQRQITQEQKRNAERE